MTQGAAKLDATVAIETPEHIVFRHRVAGPARRALAHLLDLVACYGVVFVIALIAIGADRFAESEDGGFGMGFVLLVLFVAQWVYFAVWEATYGTTPGKLALRLRVVTTTGRPIGPWAAILRNLLRAADVLPLGYVVGVGSMALTERFQRLGDLVAGTMVVVVPKRKSQTVSSLSPGPTAKELADLGQLVLDVEERAAIELFLVRRHTLSREREEELARMISGPLKRRLGLRTKDPVRLLGLVYACATGHEERNRPRSRKGGGA